jgi:hypothetical protein
VQASGSSAHLERKTYIPPSWSKQLHPMIERLTSLAAFAAYQSTVVLGIALLPLALAARRLGVTVPVHRLIERMKSAYQNDN